MHAKVLEPAGELERLEHLCRYVTRLPIATQRLAPASAWRDLIVPKRGTTPAAHSHAASAPSTSARSREQFDFA